MSIAAKVISIYASMKMRKSLLFFSLLAGFISLLIFSRHITQIIYIGALALLFVFLIVIFIGGTLLNFIFKNNILFLGKIFLTALIIGLCLMLRSKLMGVDVYYIPSVSMEPTLHTGDLAACDLWSISTLKAKDIALFKHPIKKDQIYIKRIDSIKVIENKRYKFFMRGDNSLQSEDSRVFGEIDQTDIICKATSVISPSINPKNWNIRSL